MSYGFHLFRNLLESGAETLHDNVLRAALHQNVAIPHIARRRNIPEDVQAHFLSQADPETVATMLLHNDVLLANLPDSALAKAIRRLPESTDPTSAATGFLKLILDENREADFCHLVDEYLLPLVTDAELLVRWMCYRNPEHTTDDWVDHVHQTAARLSVAETEKQLFEAPPNVRVVLLRFGVSPALAAEAAIDLVLSGHFTIWEVAFYFAAADRSVRAREVQQLVAEGKPVPENWEELTTKQGTRAREFYWFPEEGNSQNSASTEFTDRVDDVATAIQLLQETSQGMSKWMARMIFNALCNRNIPAELRQETLQILRNPENEIHTYGDAPVDALFAGDRRQRLALDLINPREHFPNEPLTWELWNDVFPFPGGALRNADLETYGGEAAVISRIPLWEKCRVPYWENMGTITPTPKLIKALPLHALITLAEEETWAISIADEIGKLYDECEDASTVIGTLLDTAESTLTLQQLADNVRAVTQ